MTVIKNRNKVIKEEVVCLGWCNGTFFRKGAEVGKKAIRRCPKCRKKEKDPKLNWTKNFTVKHLD